MSNRTVKNFIIKLFFLLIISLELFAQGNYYDNINTASPSFVDDLKARVRNPYTKISYSRFDETNIANYASYSLGDGLRGVRCVYSGYEYTYSGTFTWGTMSREHTFCHSWMPTYSSTSTNEYADQHHLFPTHQDNANAVRSNHPLGNVVTTISTFLDGKYGFDANGNRVYEPRDSHKGDAARAILYMLLRYDDINGNNWDMNWLNNTRLPQLNEAPQDLDVLLNWHFNDLPDSYEIGRNDYIQSIQKNRNPFIDHPEYVNYINFNDMSYKSNSSNTQISFSNSFASVYEYVGTYNITVQITNPSVTPTTANVVLISGDSTLIGNYTTQSITFPSSSSTNQTVTLTINNNSVVNLDQEFIFELQNIAGGNSAQAGNHPTFRLTVMDDENRLIITEVADTTGTGNFIYEFVEIYNPKSKEINVSNYKLTQYNSTQNYTIPNGTVIPPQGFLVIGRNSSKSAFETFWNTTLDNDKVIYLNSGGNAVPQLNGDEVFSIRDNNNVIVDPMIDTATAVQLIAGKRLTRLNFNNQISSWEMKFGGTATPGSLENEQTLPVELVYFTGEVMGKQIILKWKTATEINCYGFEVQRKAMNLPNISEWITIGFVQGNGNSTSEKVYDFYDTNNKSEKFLYRLKQIDFDGQFSFSNIIMVDNKLPVELMLIQNYPNPFNPITNIKFNIPNISSLKNKTSNTSELIKVSLKIYDILGNEIVQLINNSLHPGTYTIEWNASNSPAGIYFYQLVAEDFIISKKMLLIK